MALMRSMVALRLALTRAAILSSVLLLGCEQIALGAQVTASPAPNFTMDNGVGLPFYSNDSTKNLYVGFTLTYPQAFTATNIILHTCDSAGMKISISQGSSINDRAASPVIAYGTATSAILPCPNGFASDVTNDAYSVTYDFGGPITFKADVPIYAEFIAAASDGNVGSPYPFGSPGLVGAGLNYPVSELQFCYSYFCGAPSWGYSASTSTTYSTAFRFTAQSMLPPTVTKWLWPIKGSDDRSLIRQDFAEFKSVCGSLKGVAASSDCMQYNKVTQQYDIPGSLTPHHTGFDIGVGVGTQVVATADASVVMLQRSKARDATACRSPGTSTPQSTSNCGDHGDGNTILLQHRIGNPNVPIFIYSQYQHLSSFDANLEAKISAAGVCAPETPSGATICEPSGNGDFPIIVKAGDSIGLSGASGNGAPDTYKPHLHFEFKAFPALAKLRPGSNTFEYGYTTELPSVLGYIDPSSLLDVLNGSDIEPARLLDTLGLVGQRMIVKVIVGTKKHVGPRNDYSCGLYIANPPNTPGADQPQGCPTQLGGAAGRQNIDPQVGDLFIATLQSNPTPTSGCSLGWYRVVQTGRDIALLRQPGAYFQQGDLSRDGSIPDAWICRGDAGVEWVSPVRVGTFNVGDINNDGVVDQVDLGMIHDSIPLNVTAQCKLPGLSASTIDLRNLDGNKRINWTDLKIAQRLCSPVCTTTQWPDSTWPQCP